jgi:hypothetical protein
VLGFLACFCCFPDLKIANGLHVLFSPDEIQRLDADIFGE